jgi:hypothetical protein
MSMALSPALLLFVFYPTRLSVREVRGVASRLLNPLLENLHIVV